MKPSEQDYSSALSTKHLALICVGTIIATHGVKGRVKIKTYTEEPANLTSYGDLLDSEGKIYKIKITGYQPENVLAEIEGVNSMEVAQGLMGKDLFVPRSNMPEPSDGSYYYSDLIGLKVFQLDKSEFGIVKAMDHFGAGEVIEITKKDGAEEMFSFDNKTFPEVNIKGGYLVINPPEIIIDSE